jgi:RimJ/RimL family protein N-acetyltransferase
MGMSAEPTRGARFSTTRIRLPHDDDSLDRIYGERVMLRELMREDVDLMAAWPKFHEPPLLWANLDLDRPADRDGWYERSRSNATRRRFTIFDRDARAIGTIGLRNVDYRFGEGTLGIIVNAGDVSRGLGTDAVRALIRYSFERLGLRKVYLDVAQGNDRARRCYEGVGFVHIGEHRGTEGLTYQDMVLTRDRYRTGTAGSQSAR